MKKLIYLLPLIFAAIFYYGCQQDAGLVGPVDVGGNLSRLSVVTPPAEYCGDETVVTLWGGKTINTGNVTVGNDDQYLYVTYNTVDSWSLKEVHLDYSSFSFTERGSPGQYPYQAGIFNPLAQTFTFKILLTELGKTVGDNICFRAHAAVVETDSNGTEIGGETAYGGDVVDPNGGSWFGTFCYEIQDCNEQPPLEGCETAFAFGKTSLKNYATCFSELGYSRWGWTNGPLTTGSYTFPIYAAAGRCDITKGTHVGNLTINYSGSEAVVKYNIFSSYSLDEVHLYVGSDKLPKNKKGASTLAPGLYPYKPVIVNNSAESKIKIKGDIYVVAHAVVCGL